MLNIVTGPARSGKSEHIFRQMRALAAVRKPSLLIVPESYSHAAERRMLEICGNSGGRYAAVTSWSRLARDILAQAGVRPKTLDGGGRVLHMYSALTACQGALRHFKGAPRPQLVARLLETLDELNAVGIEPEALLKAAESDDLPDKIYDLGLVYAAYNSRVRQSGLDPRDPFDIACELLPESHWVAGLHLFVDGFSGFTAQRRRALGHLLGRCESVTVALLLGDDPVLFTQQQKTVDQLKRLARQTGVPVRELRMESREEEPLAALAAAAFDYSVKEVPPVGDCLALYSCLSPAEECRLAAAKVRRLVVAEGVRARRIAVVCGDMQAYGPLLENAFARYDVPFFLSQPEDVLQKPPVTAVLAVLEALDGGLTVQGVMAWLKSDLAGVGRADRDRLENYALTWNLRGSAWLRPFTLATTGYGNPVPDEADRLAALEAIRRRVAVPLEALRGGLQACETGGQYADTLRAHLEATGYAQRLEARADTLAQAGQPRLAMQYAQLAAIVDSALAQLADALSGEALTLHDFTRLLRLTLSQYSVDTIPASLDSVVACPFERLPMGQITHVFILGARDGLLPPRQGGGGLLSESERIRLEGAGIVLTQSAEEMAFETQSYIYRALACGRHLTLTLPQSGADGAPCRPSFILRRIKALTGVSELPAGRWLAAADLSADLPAFEAACRARTEPDNPVAAAAWGRLASQPEQAARLDAIAAWAENPRAPIRSRGLVAGIYGEQLAMTASRVERIAACRFSYFMQYGLRAEARREARFGAPEIGTFVHEVVEKTVQHLCANPEADLEATAEGHVRQFMSDALRGKAMTARLRGIFDILRRNVTLIVRNVWEEIGSGDFRPLWFELDFSGHGHVPPLTVETASGVTAQVRGKIDRVDGWVHEDTLYLKVVDYKTGRKTFRLSDIYHGLNLQMFLYLSMLARGGGGALNDRAGQVLGAGGSETMPAGALYIPAKAPWAAAKPGDSPEEIQRSIDKALGRIGIVSAQEEVLNALEHSDSGRFRFLPVAVKKDGGFASGSSVADAEQMGTLIRRTENTLRQLADDIARGDISANPYRSGRDHTACDWCDYRPACHFDLTLRGDRLRYLKPMKDSEVYQKLAEEEAQAYGC